MELCQIMSTTIIFCNVDYSYNSNDKNFKFKNVTVFFFSPQIGNFSKYHFKEKIPM